MKLDCIQCISMAERRKETSCSGNHGKSVILRPRCLVLRPWRPNLPLNPNQFSARLMRIICLQSGSRQWGVSIPEQSRRIRREKKLAFVHLTRSMQRNVSGNQNRRYICISVDNILVFPRAYRDTFGEPTCTPALSRECKDRQDAMQLQPRTVTRQGHSDPMQMRSRHPGRDLLDV